MVVNTKNNLSTNIVGVIMALLLVCVVAIPIISGLSSANTITVSNTENYDLHYIGEYSTEDTITITREANSTSYFVNGVECDFSVKSAEFVLICDAMSIQKYPTGEKGLHIRSNDGQFIDIRCNETGTYAINLTFANGKINGNAGTKTYTDLEYTKLYAFKEDGDWISGSIFGTGSLPNVITNKTDIITAWFATSGGSNYEYAMSIGDKLYWNMGEDYTFTMPTETYNTNFEKVTNSLRIDYNLGDDPHYDTNGFWIMPAEASYTHSETAIKLIGIVPIMLIVAVLLAAVSTIGVKKSE